MPIQFAASRGRLAQIPIYSNHVKNRVMSSESGGTILSAWQDGWSALADHDGAGVMFQINGIRF